MLMQSHRIKILILSLQLFKDVASVTIVICTCCVHDMFLPVHKTCVVNVVTILVRAINVVTE